MALVLARSRGPPPGSGEHPFVVWPPISTCVTHAAAISLSPAKGGGRTRGPAKVGSASGLNRCDMAGEVRQW
jgi:hypothetical protein